MNNFEIYNKTNGKTVDIEKDPYFKDGGVCIGLDGKILLSSHGSIICCATDNYGVRPVSNNRTLILPEKDMIYQLDYSSIFSSNINIVPVMMKNLLLHEVQTLMAGNSEEYFLTYDEAKAKALYVKENGFSERQRSIMIARTFDELER